MAVPARFESLEQIGHYIYAIAESVGLDAHASWQVQLAVDEAVTNVIQHGYGQNEDATIEVSWSADAEQLTVRLHDRGRRFDPDTVPPPDVTSPLEDRQAGGLGLFLMGRLMDSVHFTFDDVDGNLLTMTKRLVRPTIASQFLLSGRLDAIGAVHALDAVKRAVADGERYLVLDLTQVSFMSSSGLRALLLLRKDVLARGGTVTLCAMQPTVFEVFSLTGFTQVFEIYPTRDAALAAVQRAMQ